MKPTIEQLGFSYPCDSAKITEALQKHYAINSSSVCSSIERIISGKHTKADETEIKKFKESGLSFFDKAFMGVGLSDSICAVAVPKDVRYKQALRILNLQT